MEYRNIGISGKQLPSINLPRFFTGITSLFIFDVMNAEKNRVVLLSGSNAGDCIYNMNKAFSIIEELAGEIILKSSVYKTSPWGFTDQPDFLNRVVVIETSLQPLDLLHLLKKIEKNLGRVNAEKWKQRIIDIDILFYNEIIFESEELIIPHPLLHKRKFTLVPLNEIIPGFVHPLLKKKIKELLNDCEDAGEVKRMNADFSPKVTKESFGKSIRIKL